MKIYGVRHTEYINPEGVYAFHLPLQLSGKGRADALLIGKYLSPRLRGNTVVYSSPITRSVQTSEIIAAITNSSVQVDERITETSCPNLQGVIMSEQQSWKIEEDDPSREKKNSVLQRTLEFLAEKLIQEKEFVFVSHGDPLTLLHYHIQQRQVPRYLWDPAMSEFVINRGEILEIQELGGKIISCNKINFHLLN